MSPRVAVLFKEDTVVEREEPRLRVLASSEHNAHTHDEQIEPICAKAKPHAHQNIAQQQELVLQFRIDAKRIARSFIRKWRCRIEAEELDSVVDLALCEAAVSFDPTRGTRFITLLYYHVKGRIIQTIAARANAANHMSRFTIPAGADDSSGNKDAISALEQKIFICSRPLPDEQILQRDIVDRCAVAMTYLHGLEREVIERIYFQNQDMSEVTSALGYSRSHLSRIRIRALKKLQLALGLPPTANY